MILIRSIFLLMLLGRCASDNCNQMKYRQLNNVLLPTISSTFTTSSLTACCEACSTNASCRIVRYNSTSHLCEESSSQLVLYLPSSPGELPVYATAASSVYELLKTSKTRNNAEMHCIENGGHLIQIDSTTEQSLLGGFLEEYGHNADISSASGPWIGLTYHTTGQVFTWADGSSLGSYTNWGDGQPDNAGSIEHCVHTQNGNDSWKWNDLRCDTQLWSVCEYNTGG